jgi:hypothetical protein
MCPVPRRASLLYRSYSLTTSLKSQSVKLPNLCRYFYLAFESMVASRIYSPAASSPFDTCNLYAIGWRRGNQVVITD